MKKIVLLFFMVLSSVVFSQDEVTWLTDFAEAKQQAKQANKPLIMYLTGSDWCSPCKKLKSDFFENEDLSSFFFNQFCSFSFMICKCLLRFLVDY